MAQPPDEGFKVTDRRRREEADAPREPVDSPSLADLFMMLGAEAFVALGDAPDPAGQRQQVLPHAADMINLLLLLREKTEGNRTAEETAILEQLLYDLQLRYVRATKSAG